MQQDENGEKMKELNMNNENMTEKHLRVVIAGGGTGGHIFPALAIANALKKLHSATEILFIGAKGKMEMDKIPEAGYEVKGLDIAGYNRSSVLKNISLPVKLVKSYLQVRKIFKAFKPDAVIGVGGYSTYPVLRYAQSQNIPTFIHEANSLGGKSNIMLSKRARKIFTGSTGMEKYFPAAKIMVTGNPVRAELLQPVSREDALAYFGLQPNMKTVFVFGGSLGAQSINEAIADNIEAFKKNDLQLIWQTGKDFAKTAAGIEEEHKHMWTNAFVSEMRFAYAAADVVVSRAGAMTVAEICVVKKATIFVPYPYAAEDHQTVNAMSLVNEGAAWLVRDAEVKTRLMPAILELINDKEKIEQLEQNIEKLGRFDVDELIASELLKELKIKS